jgi:hypothetical protein
MEKEENMYRSRTAINQPLTGRNRKGRKKMCGLMIIESGLRQGRTSNGCVKVNH